MSKRFSHARFQRMTSARFVGTSVVSMFVETGIGSVKLVRTPNTSWLDWNKTTRVFEYQSRWISGLDPLHLRIFLMSLRSLVPPSLFLMLCLCPPVSSRVLVSSILFPDRVGRPGLFAGLPFLCSAPSCARSPEACRRVLVSLHFTRPARSVRDCLKRADLPSSGFIFYVQVDLVRGLNHADLYSPDLFFFVTLDLVRDHLTCADLYPPGLMFLVPARSCAQNDWSTSFESTQVGFEAYCVMFQYDHHPVAPPQ